jgi:hypothetical protein
MESPLRYVPKYLCILMVRTRHHQTQESAHRGTLDIEVSALFRDSHKLAKIVKWHMIC